MKKKNRAQGQKATVSRDVIPASLLGECDSYKEAIKMLSVRTALCREFVVDAFAHRIFQS